MFEPPKELLEVVLFDYEGDLYGSRIEVALRHFIRPEMKFDGLDALKTQMDADAARARQLLA
jgi:riboflavin kinase/FMN adenylyltransferase